MEEENSEERSEKAFIKKKCEGEKSDGWKRKNIEEKRVKNGERVGRNRNKVGGRVKNRVRSFPTNSKVSLNRTLATGEVVNIATCCLTEILFDSNSNKRPLSISKLKLFSCFHA